MKTIERDACISACGHYRWSLSREWDWQKPWLGWIMLNPSTADASTDDPTIRRCMRFAIDWGYGGIAVRNLFAFRATDPDELLRAVNPVGDQNNAAILDLWDVCPKVVAAWGAFPQAAPRAAEVCRAIAGHGFQLHCLGVTKSGAPVHPLYIPSDRTAVEYSREEASL